MLIFLNKTIYFLLLFFPIILWISSQTAFSKPIQLVFSIFAIGYFILSPSKISLKVKVAAVVFLLSLALWVPGFHGERIYPFLNSLIFLMVFVGAYRKKDNLLSSFAKPFLKRPLDLVEKKALQQSLIIWILGLSLNTAILFIYLFRFSLDSWVKYSHIYSYILLFSLFITTSIYIVFRRFSILSSFIFRVKEVLFQSTGLLLFGLCSILLVLFIPLLKLYYFGNEEKFKNTCQFLVHTAFKYSLKYCEWIRLIDLKIYNSIDCQQAKLIVANHLSMMDILSILYLFPNCYTFVHSKYLKYPYLKSIIKSCGYIPIDPTNIQSRISAFEQAKALLKKGKKLAIFPEGTRSLDGTLGTFQKGIFRLAIEDSIDIKPLFFTLSKPFFNKNGMFHFNKIPISFHIHILPKIEVKCFQNNTFSVNKNTTELHKFCIKLYQDFSKSSKCLSWNKYKEVK